MEYILAIAGLILIFIFFTDIGKSMDKGLIIIGIVCGIVLMWYTVAKFLFGLVI